MAASPKPWIYTIMIVDTQSNFSANQKFISDWIAQIAKVVNEADKTPRTKKKSILAFYSGIMDIKVPRNNTNATTLAWLKANATEEKLAECRTKIKLGLPRNIVHKTKQAMKPEPTLGNKLKAPKTKVEKVGKVKKLTLANYDVKQGWIYAIENRVNGKVYIGSTRNLVGRWESHLKELTKGKHHTRRFQEDWDNHKPNDFEIRELHNIRRIGNYGLLEMESFEIKDAVNKKGRDAVYNTELDPFKREITGSQTYIK